VTVAVLGTGRMAGIHLAALAELRDRGLLVDGKTVRVVPAVYGRDPAKVRAVAEPLNISRTSSRLEELIDAADVDLIDNCLVNAEHYGPLMRAIGAGKHVSPRSP
jgi:predicted dehydrogenase